jgi:transcriptional regulator with XRE-family HTH domain
MRMNEEDVAVRFGENVWWLRTQRRLTQSALAARAGIHRSQIPQVENARQTARIESVVAIAGGLEVPIGDLFGGIRFEPFVDHPGRYVVEPLDLPTVRAIRVDGRLAAAKDGER